MKAPRVNDFDPNASPTLKSPLDDMPTIGHEPQKVISENLDTTDYGKEKTLVASESPSAVLTETPSVRTPVRVKRTITRYAFEFFQDQIDQLKKFSLNEQLMGEKGSMSQMVREALDAYIAKRIRTEE